jgi:uncharacterized C2H2 Zn-finger protein
MDREEMNEQSIGENLIKCAHCGILYSSRENHSMCTGTGTFLQIDTESRLLCECPKCGIQFEKDLGDPDLENCTIRELEMFKIGFEHGRRVANGKNTNN